MLLGCSWLREQACWCVVSPMLTLRGWGRGCGRERGVPSCVLCVVEKVWKEVLMVHEAALCALLNSGLQRGGDASGRVINEGNLAEVRRHSVLALDGPPTCPGGLLWLPWENERLRVAGGLRLSLRAVAWCSAVLSVTGCS